MTKYVILKQTFILKIITTDKTITNDKYEVVLFPNEDDLKWSASLQLYTFDNLIEAENKRKQVMLLDFQKTHIQMCSMSLILTVQVLSQYVDKFPTNVKDAYIDMLIDLMDAQYNYLEQQPFSFNPNSAHTLQTIKNIMRAGHWDSFLKTIDHYRIFEKDAPTIKLVDSIKELNETETTV